MGTLMAFRSILFQHGGDDTRRSAPDYFADLNLDQIVAAVTRGKEEYDLAPFFYLPLTDPDDIVFRQEIMRDLEKAALYEAIESFAKRMRTMRRYLAQGEMLSYQHQKERWFLDAVDAYCNAVSRLGDALPKAAVTSRGLTAFCEYLIGYANSDEFLGLLGHTKALKNDLGGIRYKLVIDGLEVEARQDQGEPNYGAELEATFERFKQGAVNRYEFDFIDSAAMNRVEGGILDLVVRLYPSLFTELGEYCAQRKGFADQVLVRFDREIQFYVAYVANLAPLKNLGLKFCYPRVLRDSKEVYDYQGFDLALAGILSAAGHAPVCNDFHLKDAERMVVVTGPNQGGKTTFARTFGQLHHLGSLGCPVPGSKAQLYLCDRIFTHFERAEDISNLRGKLQDDLVRIHAILDVATSHSVVVINEIFSSTAFRDALLLSKVVAAKLAALDLLGVWVTFIDELSILVEQTVSMTSTVNPRDPTQRTYRVVRRHADGLAYAQAIAERYRLTYVKILERMEP